MDAQNELKPTPSKNVHFKQPTPLPIPQSGSHSILPLAGDRQGESFSGGTARNPSECHSRCPACLAGFSHQPFWIEGASRLLSKSPPGRSNFKNLRKPSVFSPSPSILIDGEGRGGVGLSFRDVRWFVDRNVILRVPLSIILSPRFAGGARKPEALGWWMRLKWPFPSRLEMLSNQPLHFSSSPPSPAQKLRCALGLARLTNEIGNVDGFG